MRKEKLSLIVFDAFGERKKFQDLTIEKLEKSLTGKNIYKGEFSLFIRLVFKSSLAKFKSKYV